MSDPKIKRVLVSVTDKTGVADFARALVNEFGAEIISTGGTARALKDAGVPILGTSPEAINLAEERGAFGKLLDDAGLTAPAYASGSQRRSASSREQHA